MKIGIDIDGVLTNTLAFMREEGSKFAVQVKEGKMQDPNAYETIKMFGWSRETDKKFWDENIFSYAKNTKILPDAKESIENIKKQGNEIIILTARRFSAQLNRRGTRMRNIVKQWLNKNQIVYDKILFAEKDKGEYCREYGIDMMIEDCPENIRKLSKDIPVICYHWPYNEKVEGKNIIKCDDWKEVEECVLSYEGKIH